MRFRNPSLPPRLVDSISQFTRSRSFTFGRVLFLVLLPVLSNAQVNPSDPQIEITQNVPASSQRSFNLAFKIKNASDKRVRVIVIGEVFTVTSQDLALSSKGEHVLVINLLKGRNTIEIVGFANDEPVKLKIAPNNSAIVVQCIAKWCYEQLNEKTVATEFPPEESNTGRGGNEQQAQVQQNPGATPTPAKPAKKEDKSNSSISITKPTASEGPVRYQDVGEIPLEIRIDQKPEKKDNIKNVAVTVLNEEGPVNQAKNKLSLEYAKNTSNPAVVQPLVRVGKGTNKVTVFDPKNPEKETTSLSVVCEGEKCGQTQDDSPVDRFSSIYTRGIVGFEQSGASAAGSVQKPFLEFFWNPPIATNDEGKEPFKYVYPRASLWGSVRFTSVPQQISTPLVTFAPSFLSPIYNGNVNKLVQGFDFLVGLEMGIGRGFRKGEIGTMFLPSGTPDTKQRHSAYLFFGVGSSSPLNPHDTVQIFKAPTSQSELDKIQPGLKLPTGTEYIAFAEPERNSFFRQYYAGIRFKTHYFKEGANGKLELVNRPGGMFDISIGQNEAVTGGRLSGMVLRFDGFYPLPISNRSIVYLYGNAFVNLRRRAEVNDPLILATAPSNITVPADNVFLLTTKPSNRDLYRIGIGVNLIELFKSSFNKKEEKSN